MSPYPIATSATEALRAPRGAAATAQEAQARLGAPVFLAIEPLPQAFGSLEDAEREAPGLYGDPKLEALWADGGWRVMVRFWRPAPPFPVARTLAAALKRPLAHARTPEEAAAALGGPAELAGALRPRRYRSHAAAIAAHREAFDAGFAEITERDGGFAVSIRYWRPLPGGSARRVAPAERAQMATQAAAPLTASAPQLPLDIGLFERLAPENEAIVLAEEGDGRFRGE